MEFFHSNQIAERQFILFPTGEVLGICRAHVAATVLCNRAGYGLLGSVRDGPFPSALPAMEAASEACSMRQWLLRKGGCEGPGCLLMECEANKTEEADGDEKDGQK